MKEKVIIRLSAIGSGSAQSDLINASITITDNYTLEIIASETWLGNDIVVLIDPNVNYLISVSSVTGYKTPNNILNKSYALNEVTFNIVYPSSTGIYIMDKQGNYYDSQTWSDAKTTGAVTNGDANGIACLGANSNFLIAPYVLTERIGPESDRYQGITDPTVFPYMSATDFNGSYNTSRWLARYPNAYAAFTATNYTFPDGQKNGYIPASGQLHYIVLDNWSLISNLFSEIGITLSTNNYVGSTNFGYYSDAGSVCVYGTRPGYINYSMYLFDVCNLIIIRNI